VNPEIPAALEALLFASDAPVELGRIAEVLELPVEEARAAVEALRGACESSGRGLAVAEPEVAKQLNLTSDQQKQVTEIVEKGREQFRQSFQGGQGDREERAQRMTKLREEQNEKLSAVLTAEQKEQWKKMLGEKFDVSQLRRGGGPRPRNDA